MMDIIKFVRTNAIFDVISDKVILDLVISELPVKIPENERSNRILTKD
jgi:hypothetical protein